MEDGLPLGHRNLSLSSDYDYHHAMAQHAAVVSAANNSNIHPAMAQLSMLPAGLNLSVNSGQGMSGIAGSSLNNSNTSHLTHHGGSTPNYHSGTPTTTTTSSSSASHKKQKKPKVNKDGVPAPKRATTAYINFTQWYREELKKAGRQIPRIGDFGKECAGKWNSMTEDEKTPFLNAANRDKERYKREMAIYKPARDVNKPKRPGTAFMLFMGDFRKTMAGKEPDGGVAALAKLGGEKWRGMSEEEKRPYVEKQNDEKIRYEGNMEEYRRKPLPVTIQQSVDIVQPAKPPQRHNDDSSQESSESQDNMSTSHVTQSSHNQSANSNRSGNSTPVSQSSSPPAQTVSPGSNSSSSQQNSASATPTTTGGGGSGVLPSLSSSMSLPHALASMGYTQHSLPNFAHSGTVLAAAAAASNYNQNHPHATTMPATYLANSGATYSQAHLPGHYSWT